MAKVQHLFPNQGHWNGCASRFLIRRLYLQKSWIEKREEVLSLLLLKTILLPKNTFQKQTF